MLYRVIGLMSGSSLDGLDIAFVEFNEQAGKWEYQLAAAACYEYTIELKEELRQATQFSALDYQLLHTRYGRHLGEMVNRFIEEHELHYKVSLVSSHGHTSFHLPAQRMTAQLGDGAAIAAETRLPVVSDLRALDVAFGGEGAPIVPIGEKLLFPQYKFLLNLGGIANLSIVDEGNYLAFDICPANRVLNLLVNSEGLEYDDEGKLARSGTVNLTLLEALNGLSYYSTSPPKSLANGFGTNEVYPLTRSFQLSTADSLRTFVEHIVIQISNAVPSNQEAAYSQMLVTGGGAFNSFLVERLQEQLQSHQIEVVVPNEQTVRYKEAIVMALIGVLRWRQEYNVLASVTGAERNSIGGALWIGQEA